MPRSSSLSFILRGFSLLCHPPSEMLVALGPPLYWGLSPRAPTDAIACNDVAICSPCLPRLDASLRIGVCFATFQSAAAHCWKLSHTRHKPGISYFMHRPMIVVFTWRWLVERTWAQWLCCTHIYCTTSLMRSSVTVLQFGLLVSLETRQASSYWRLLFWL